MLIEFPQAISVDKNPLVKDIRLNVQAEKHQLRLKAEYIHGELVTPVDLVVFRWTPKLDKLSLSILIDGKELTTQTDFLIKLSYDVIRNNLKLSGNIAGKEIKKNLTSIQDFLEIPKYVLGIQ